MTIAFLDNLLGHSDSLKVARTVIGIRRQGNGHFAATKFIEWADGSKGHSDIGVNFRTAREAKDFGAQQAGVLGAAGPVILSSARAA